MIRLMIEKAVVFCLGKRADVVSGEQAFGSGSEREITPRD